MHFLVEFEPMSQQLRSFSRFRSQEEARHACAVRMNRPLQAEQNGRLEPSYYQIFDEQHWEQYLQQHVKRLSLEELSQLDRVRIAGSCIRRHG